jgi:hypothetical protein
VREPPVFDSRIWVGGIGGEVWAMLTGRSSFTDSRNNLWLVQIYIRQRESL